MKQKKLNPIISSDIYESSIDNVFKMIHVLYTKEYSRVNFIILLTFDERIVVDQSNS